MWVTALSLCTRDLDNFFYVNIFVDK